MASLADELLADLGSDGSDAEVEQDQPSEDANHSSNAHQDANGRSYGDELMDDASEPEDEEEEEEKGLENGRDGEGSGGPMMVLGRNAVKPAEEMDQSDVDRMDLHQVQRVRSVAKLMDSGKIDSVMKSIEHFMALPEPDIEGVLEETPEYQLIVKANNLAVDVDNEVMVVHKFIRDHYSPRFPELESLILNPWEFVQAVQALGNDEDLSRAKLEGILPHGIVVVISMTASTTEGKPLDKETWDRVQEACDLVFELEGIRRKILQYVESRMTFIAPNLSAVVGTRVATKLLGVAGGLDGLSKIPACNVPFLGASKKNAVGLSVAHGASTRFSGFIAQSELITNTPEEYRRQAVRMVSAKALLAARMDSGHSNRDGSYGSRLHDELVKKLEKLQEPPPAKLTKVLPIPKEGGNKKRRGGRRARKLKELYGMTELRKMQNRMEFGKAEEEAGAFDETVGLGMIHTTASGKLRAQVAEARSKAKISKANKNRLAAFRTKPSANLEASSGTASSLSFTPVQGIELVDPSRQRKVDEANAKWFKEGQFSLLPGVGANAQKFPGAMPPPPPKQPSSSSSSMGPPSVSRR
ncbi:Nop domain-containing protein [Violaceomyces palustris]|uniref:Nop domain-containing protein n=1 Tax=Violaceomyces palustris TaxID=1673888 RepID=A0ACD0P823_9BASI|nr:Nop domain-containing protein [Violaceomyces palustris]